jgi:hypothetical protein
MTTDGHLARTFRTQEISSLSRSWDHIQKWARNPLALDKVAGAALVVGTFLAGGFFLHVLSMAFHKWTLTGF